MARLVAGEPHSFEQCYDRLAGPLFSCIYAILHDHKESEDVLQESFVQIWRKAATYDSTRSSLFTWSVMIARNRAIDRVRARQRYARAAEGAAEHHEISATLMESEGQADIMAAGEERTRVRGALARLNESQQEAIALAFFSGLTQAEISKKLNAPLGTIKARIRRGLLSLRDILGGAEA